MLNVLAKRFEFVKIGSMNRIEAFHYFKKGLLAFCVMSVLQGCGYNLRGDTRPLFDKYEIKTVYVPPVKNNSYKAGVEIVVYNALRKKLSEGGYIRIVDKEDLADASFSAIVYKAYYDAGAATTANVLSSVEGNTAPSNVQVATLYTVNLKVAFVLRKLKDSKVIWSDELTRSKTFAATTYLGSLGSTSALINESDFDRTLSDLSLTIVTDAEESANSIL